MIDELKIYRLPEIDIIGDATAHFTEPHFPPGEIPLEESNRRRDQLFQHWELYFSHCDLCKKAGVSDDGEHLQKMYPILGAGNRNADIMIIGIGPGKDEDEQRIPFIGRSGQELRKALRQVQGVEMDPSEIYLTNSILCRPYRINKETGFENNRDPVALELQLCRPKLFITIGLVSPKVIICAGEIPYSNITGLVDVSVGREICRPAIVEYTDWNKQPRRAFLLIMYHPSAVIRMDNDKAKQELFMQGIRKSLILAVELAKKGVPE